AAKRRNALAKALRDPRWSQRTVKARKGRGSYRRARRRGGSLNEKSPGGARTPRG
ncbi:MAG: alternative ribosome rescue factor ArfA, partial [Acetobacteraceae bacterium]